MEKALFFMRIVCDERLHSHETGYINIQIKHKCQKYDYWKHNIHERSSLLYGSAFEGTMLYNHIDKFWYTTNNEYATKVVYCPFCGIELNTLIVP